MSSTDALDEAGNEPVEDLSDLRAGALEVDPETGEVVTGEVDEEEPDVPTAVEGRGRNGLEIDVRVVTDEFWNETWAPVDRSGQTALLTPHHVAKRIQESDGLDSRPSTGAIANTFNRWANIGFAEIGTDPCLHFIGYTSKGCDIGLSGCKEEAKAAKKAERQAAKRAAAETAEAAETAASNE